MRIRKAIAGIATGAAAVAAISAVPANAQAGKPGPKGVHTTGVIHPLSVEGPLSKWCLTVISPHNEKGVPLYLEPCIRKNGKADPNQVFRTFMFRGFGFISVVASGGTMCIGQKGSMVTVQTVYCAAEKPDLNYHLHFSAVGGEENQIVESGPHQMTVTAHPRLSVKAYQLGWRPGGEPKNKFIQVFRFTPFS